MSTASLASYHLGRLTEVGYVSKDSFGRYLVVPEASVQVLGGYARIGPAIVPQLYFFTIVFTILTAFFSTLTLSSPSFAVYLIATSVAMVVTFWYETVRLWRRLPSLTQ